MVDFRNYKDLIRAEVAAMNDRDKNWKWSVKSISQKKVSIRWGYLDYLEEKQNCFILKLEHFAGDVIWACLPNGLEIYDCCYMVAEKPNPRIGAEMKVESGIRCALDAIEHYAHSRY